VVQPMKHLPLALVRGTVASIETAVRGGAANDVYPDDPIERFDRASADAMGTARATGSWVHRKGVGRARAAVVGSDSRTFTADVPSTTTHLKITLSHPSLAVVGSNAMI
jgi:serine protease AprX